MDDDIERFIYERVDEDEARAQTASTSPWEAIDRGYSVRIIDSEGLTVTGWEETDLPRTAFLTDAPDVQHILHNDPTAVLRRCVLVRAMLNYASEAWNPQMYRDIAAYWNTHPDYQQKWKP